MSMLTNFINYILTVIDRMDTLLLVYSSDVTLLSFIIYVAILLILIKIAKELIR